MPGGQLIPGKPRIFILMTALFLIASATSASADPGFRKWISDFKSVAAKSGISGRTYDAVFAGVKTPDMEVIESAYLPSITADRPRSTKASLRGRRIFFAAVFTVAFPL